MHLINLVVGPILTGLSVLLFPQIIDEVMAMDESGMLAISILIIFFVVPVLASSFGKDWLAGILNGCGFLSVGMIISGVVPSTVILGLVGIMVKLFGIVAIPLVLIMFLFA